MKQIHQAIKNGKTANGITLYLHLPFCEQLCTYCGCNKRITKNHSVETIYIDALLKEWNIYKNIFQDKIKIKEIHLGGGTPTFFSPQNLQHLIQEILKDNIVEENHEFSFEGHPNNTTQEHLKVLYDIGFRRVSFGVQDLDLKVQKAINRVQPFEKTKAVTDWARSIGYESINYDLIYGLPFQTAESIKHTIEKTITLQPYRIAFYSYAHVPWTSKSQRAYSEDDLPKGKEKYELYTIGKDLFNNAGYEEVGMDHFALKEDTLLQAKRNQTLHRNFMGYTTNNTPVLIGLGVSAISDVFFGYRQNLKTVEAYYEALKDNQLPIFRGIDLTKEDIINRQHILNIACNGTTSWKNDFVFTPTAQTNLKTLQADNIIILENNTITLTDLGWRFLRNVCALFDEKLMNDTKLKDTPKFSNAV
ncbi:MAG: oxygen-independent coproporphyrinogen III oxidase [Chitinophagales bacterium]